MSKQLTKFIKGVLPILEEIGGEHRRFLPGETVIREGERGDAIFIIETGHVRIVWGSEQFEMARSGAGEVLGELSYLGNIPHTATVITEEKSAILILPRKAMKKLAQRSPTLYAEFNQHLIHILAERFRFNAEMRHELQTQKKEISELTEKLQELDRLKSHFFANISHEFRTPLMLILGPAERLLEKFSGDDKKSLSLIRSNAQRLLRLINQLLDLSKLESDKLQLQTSPGDFSAFLKGLVMSFESLAKRKGVELRFDAQLSEGSEPSESYFDRDKIEKIFSNLLSNAFKFTPPGGKISVQLAMNNEQISEKNPSLNAFEQLTIDHCTLITVKDTGEGISPEHLPYIFDRFYQVDSSSHRTHGGTGIGLALVKELVDLHYGSIAVASEQGKGTTFTICLPLGKEHLEPKEMVEAEISHQPSAFSGQYLDDAVLEQSQQPPKTNNQQQAHGDQEPIANGQKLKADLPIILIIEDNADVRAYIREQLQAEYTILEAEDGESGIARAIETIPDLVISDVMMPKKDGYEVCHTLKTDERTSHIPIILLTAKAGEQSKVTGLETGADAYVLKPFRQQELAVRVRNLIALRRKLRARYSTAAVIKPSEIEATSMDRAFLERVIVAIEANMGEEQFSAEMLAREVAMSLSQLNRKLNALIDQPAGQMIRSLRLHRAADLLAKKSGTVAEICYAVGFSDQANFSRSFKKQFGCSPLEYQKTNSG